MSDTSSVTSARAGPDAGKVSGRKGNKKVRTGCMTCKIRKVKCDEAKPSCLRCVRTGRKCDGYPVIRPRASRTRSPSPIVGFDTPDQVHAFDYFWQRSSILLGGITNESGEFWDGIVVQLSIVEPAVRHAVLALSSLHESLAITGDSNRGASTDFAFAEYGKAIAAVRNWDTESHASDPTAIPLLVCVLFICIEFLMDYESASQLHICQGRLILAKLQHQQLSSPTMDMIRKFLVPIYARLSLATYLFAVTPEPIPGYLTYEPGYTPTSFTSINEARDVLFHILDEGLRFSTRSKPAVYEPSTEPWQLHMMEMTQQQYLTQLAQWNTAFTVFKTTLETETSASKATQSLLYVYYHAAFIWISTALSPLETAFDDHEAGFTALISHAATAIAEAGSSIKEDGAFTFETEIIAPVYWVVTKCRHPLLRRAALRLLDKEELKRRRENIWRAPELVKISSRVIETEEGTVPSQYNDTLSETYGQFDGYWHFLNDVSIPVTKMPTYQKPQVAFTEDQITADIANEASLKTQRPRHESPIGFEPIAQDSDEAASTPLLDPSCLKSPYGVPESRRIKNAIVGPHKPGGVWLTTFMDPQPGHLDWDSRRVFLRV